MKVFEAQYPGECPACEEPIKPGQPCRYDDRDQVVHDDCKASAPVERPLPAPCQKCFMVPAANGICGCDE